MERIKNVKNVKKRDLNKKRKKTFITSMLWILRVRNVRKTVELDNWGLHLKKREDQPV